MDLEKIKIGLLGVALGALALYGIGFGMGGWVLGSTSQERAETAVIDRLTSVCVAQFQRGPLEGTKNVKALKKLSYGQHGKFVASHGWATMPGESKPNSAVAVKCGDQNQRIDHYPIGHS